MVAGFYANGILGMLYGIGAANFTLIAVIWILANRFQFLDVKLDFIFLGLIAAAWMVIVVL
jgi:hypothetical protein